MSYERFQVKNLAYATLISDNTSTIDIASDLHYSLPTDTSSGPFTICIDEELLKVTDVNWDGTGNYIFDVIRAQEDTVYEAHSMGQKVFLNVTAGTINHIQDYLSLIDTTSNIDLNTIYNDTQTNNAKVTNANHTGDVTGSDVLGIVPAAISGRSEVTPANGDYVLLFDATDNTLKKSLVDTFITGGGGGGDITGPATSVLNSISYFDTTNGDSLESSNITVSDSGNSINVPQQIRNSSTHTLGSSGTYTWDIETYPVAKIEPTGNINITVDHTEINSNATLYIKQNDSTPYTITFDNTNLAWSGGYDPDFSTLGSKHLLNFFVYDSTSIFGTYINDVDTLMGNVYSDATSYGVGRIAYNDSTNSNIIDYSVVTISDVTSAINDITNLQSDVTGLEGSVLALESDVSGLMTSSVTYDSTGTFTNKLFIPRKSTLTGASNVSWSSDNGSFFTLDVTGLMEVAADSGSPDDAQLAEFRFYSTGSGALPAFDTTSGSAKSFAYGDDLSGIGFLDVSGYMYVLCQYNEPRTRWDIISKNEGF